MHLLWCTASQRIFRLYRLRVSDRTIGPRYLAIDFSFLGSKITADGDCSHEIKRCLLLGRPQTPNPPLKSGPHTLDITLRGQFLPLVRE